MITGTIDAKVQGKEFAHVLLDCSSGEIKYVESWGPYGDGDADVTFLDSRWVN